MNIASISVPALISTLHKPLLAYFNSTLLAEQHAWWLLSAITHKSKAHLLSLGKVTLTDVDYQTLQLWLVDLTVHHKPIAYILGTVPFADMSLVIEPPVLIPRPETEEWVLALIEDLRPLAGQSLRILDMCTGSGCIALALAYSMPEAQVVGVDLSERALMLAQQNAHNYALDNITFLQSDLFMQLPEEHYFDIIIANPPYIAPSEWMSLDESVAKWEDQGALVSAQDGYEHLFRIISYAPVYLKQNVELKAFNIPNLVVEIGYQQGPVIADYMKEQGAYKSAIEKDAAGKDRVVKGYFYDTEEQAEFE